MKIITRCLWVPANNQLYQQYHDDEWGMPVHDDRKHFEFLILEGAQAGLSWLTILKRRNGYNKAFSNFDPVKVANFNQRDVDRLLQDKGVIRNKLKIKSAINNAQKFLNVQQQFGSFDNYIWSFVNHQTIHHHLQKLSDYPTTIPEAENLSRDLKKQGFTFVGPTVIYAHMQACGLVNDHMNCCFRSTNIS
jgi:DNA-3-methyladenine glycosylase I